MTAQPVEEQTPAAAAVAPQRAADADAGATNADAPAVDAPVDRALPLPAVRTTLPPPEVLARLDKASLRGRLPGFESRDDGGFRVSVFGEPFDRELLCNVRGSADATTIEVRSRLLLRLPIIYIVIIIATVWPGVVLTDKLIPASWGWWPTWWWYLPLVILPLPFVLPKVWRKSEQTAHTEAHKTVRKIAGIVDGETVPA